MEVSCFFTSKPFNKTPDLVPTLKPKFSFWHKIRPNGGFYYYGYGGGVSHSFTCCNLRAELPDDSSEPTIESDWRSFRARLVVKEQASTLAGSTTPLPPDATGQSPTPRILGDKWAHPLHEPEKGCLLIATEKLDGVHIFERTVVLVLSNGPMGPTGIIINRPSLMSIKETRSTDLDLTGAFSSRPLFFGGPLEEGLFLMGPQEGEDKVGRTGVFEEVMEGLYYGTKESVGCAAEMVKRNVVGVGDFNFFDGYCGWQKEQLRDEIRGGLWTVAACRSVHPTPHLILK